MSAFLCSPRHTLVVALLATRHAAQSDTVKAAAVYETAMLLRALNNAALASRYGDKGEPLPAGLCLPSALFEASRWLRAASMADLAGVVSCFRYQCAEGDCETRPYWSTLSDLADYCKAAAQGQESAVWSI